MSTEVLKLTRHDFDTMENKHPWYCKEEGIFITDENATAYAKISKWLKDNGPFEMYTGWDREVYPKFKIELAFLK